MKKHLLSLLSILLMTFALHAQDTTENVKKNSSSIDQMERALGTYDFLTVFDICLTDRGSEFGDPVKLETGINGIERMSVYYCDPMRSGQKGGIEEVHTLLRMIIPKGTSISKITSKKKAMVIKWKKQNKQTTGYQIQYSTNSKFNSVSNITINKNKIVSKTVKKLKANKKYYVRVRTYKTVKIDGKSVKLYSDWSASKSIKTKK